MSGHIPGEKKPNIPIKCAQFLRPATGLRTLSPPPHVGLRLPEDRDHISIYAAFTNHAPLSVAINTAPLSQPPILKDKQRPSLYQSGEPNPDIPNVLPGAGHTRDYLISDRPSISLHALKDSSPKILGLARTWPPGGPFHSSSIS